MVYQHNVNTGMGTQHVNEKNDDVCTEHEAVGGVLQRNSDIVNDCEEDTSDGTDMRGRPQTQHSVVGILLNEVHTAIVQIDGGDEIATEITMQYDTIPTVTSELGNSRGDNDETPQDTTGVPGEDVGQLDTHKVRERGEQPATRNLNLSAGNCGMQKSSDDANKGDVRGDDIVPPCLSNVSTNTINNWQKYGKKELTEILRMLDIHAVPLWKSLQQCVPPDTRQDEAYQQVFAPFRDVQELRQELGCLKKGKTGRLTTVEELQDMTDKQLKPVLVICNLLLAGEGPTILKICDIIPLLKDVRRTRPITCLDPIFKLVDAVISRRLMLVLQEYGLLPEGTYRFVKKGAPEWPENLVSGIQWHARREQITSCQAFLDATSAYDTINHT